MSLSHGTRIEIRGLSKEEIVYLKALAKKSNYPSLNSFLLSMCREKMEHNQFNGANYLYASALENMKETSQHMLNMVKKQGGQIDEFEKEMTNFASRISQWLDYEGLGDYETER